MAKTSFYQKIIEHKRIFAELVEAYQKHYASFKEVGVLCGWNWWSLPPKMWRIAKALGFKNYPADDRSTHQWKYETSSYNHSNVADAAQEAALEELRKKYPNSDLLKNISISSILD